MTEEHGRRKDRINLLGVDYDNLTRVEVLDQMEKFISLGQSHYICTPNADHLLQAQRDPVFRGILHRADLVVSDGMAVVYASRWLGTPLKENVGGRLLLPAFAKRAGRIGYQIFLLGGRDPEMVNRAIEQLERQAPGLRIAGAYVPPFRPWFDEAENERMLDAIHHARPDVLFVCLGTPKQEKWIARNLACLDVPVSLGIGAALDVIAGRVNEAPRWTSDVGLEWLVRLIQEPRRLWRRYLLGGPRFLALVTRQRLMR